MSYVKNYGCSRLTCWVRAATGRIARLRRRMAALQLLAIAGYYASLRLALHHRKRTLHPVQLRILVQARPSSDNTHHANSDLP
jgi:hypothetical protein